jgi:hypothetical protein
MPLGANKVALLGVAGVSTGTSVLLATGVASASASLEFTLPTAYKQVVFGFYNIAGSTGANIGFQVNASGQTGYNETITSTFFRAYHQGDGANGQLGYQTSYDQAQGTSYQPLSREIGTNANRSGAGELVLYNPASTIYVKHFISHVTVIESAENIQNSYAAGYINTTTNLSTISFKMSSSNIASGTIKMWGVL